MNHKLANNLEGKPVMEIVKENRQRVTSISVLVWNYGQSGTELLLCSVADVDEL